MKMQQITDEVSKAAITFGGLAIAKHFAWIDWIGLTDAFLKSCAWALGGFIITHALPYAWKKLKGRGKSN